MITHSGEKDSLNYYPFSDKVAKSRSAFAICLVCIFGSFFLIIFSLISFYTMVTEKSGINLISFFFLLSCTILITGSTIWIFYGVIGYSFPIGSKISYWDAFFILFLITLGLQNLIPSKYYEKAQILGLVGSYDYFSFFIVSFCYTFILGNLILFIPGISSYLRIFMFIILIFLILIGLIKIISRSKKGEKKNKADFRGYTISGSSKFENISLMITIFTCLLVFIITVFFLLK